MEKISQRIKDLRIEHKLTQVQLSKDTGLSQAIIAQWETGVKTPSAESIVVLAKYFNCTADYLLGLQDF